MMPARLGVSVVAVPILRQEEVAKQDIGFMSGGAKWYG